MKIAFIGRGDLQNNASTLRAIGLGRELRKQGHDIYLFLPDVKKNHELREIIFPYITVLLSSNGFFEFPSKLSVMLKYRFDVVHSLNIGINSFLVSLLYKFFRRKVLLISDMDEWNSKLFSNPIRSKFLELLESLALKWSNHVICASSLLAKLFGDKVKRKIHYLPYAIDIKLFEKQSKGFEKIREAYRKKKLIVYVGSFQPHFDLDIVISAAAQVIQEENNCFFILIGNGPLREQIKNLAASMSDKHFYFPGFLSDEDVAAYLRAADVLVLPLRDNEINRSRCPNKLFLYLASKKPIVTNNVGEVGKILRQSAHYFENGDINDCAVKIIEAIFHPVHLDDSLVEENSWEFRTIQYLNILSTTG